MDLDRRELDRYITGDYGERQFSQSIPVPHWHAGYNMVGYLPEMEPGTLTSWDDAKSYMISEVEYHADNLDSWVEGDCDDDIPCGVHGEECGHNLANSLSAEEQDLNLDNGPEWGTIVGNMSYWINACEDVSCEMEDD